MKTLMIHHRHMRALNYCNRGMRACFKEQGVDWADFLENGITAEKLLASGNAMALPVIEFAKKEAGE